MMEEDRFVLLMGRDTVVATAVGLGVLPGLDLLGVFSAIPESTHGWVGILLGVTVVSVVLYLDVRRRWY